MGTEKKYLYHLVYIDGNKEVPFYVGHTGNPEERLRGHRYDAVSGQEDKYVFIREVVRLNGWEWDMRVVKEVPVGDFPGDWEDWEIIRLIRRGVVLTNMKKGDADWINQVRTLSSDRERVRSVDDVKREREAREGEAMERARLMSRKMLVRNDRDDIAWLLEGVVEWCVEHSDITWLQNKVFYEWGDVCLTRGPRVERNQLKLRLGTSRKKMWCYWQVIDPCDHLARECAARLCKGARVFVNRTGRPIELLAKRVASNYTTLDDFVWDITYLGVPQEAIRYALSRGESCE